MSDVSLGGARVALLEARLAGELASLVERMGGVPVSAPAVREEPLDAAPVAERLLDALAAGRVHVVAFLTGVGARLLFDGAERLGRLDELRDALAGVVVAIRGPKPAAALRERGVRPTVQAASPHTSTELLAALAEVDVRGRGVAVVEYGAPNELLADALRERGAEVETLQVYEWRPPEDPAPLAALVDEVIGGRVDAVAFTSQVQVRHLVEAAERAGRRDALLAALGATVVTVSIGPTCTAALESLGVAPHVTADPPKMRPMLTALAAHLARGGPSTPTALPAP